MKLPGRSLLIVGAGCSLTVTALHVAIALGGPPWYRWFGAPSLADQIERGSVSGPIALTLGVAALFVVWSCYALSGAGVIRRLPLVRTALFVMAGVYLFRGLPFVPEVLAVSRGAAPMRIPAFSAFSGLSGIVYLLGVLAIVRSGRAATAHAG